MTNNLQDEQFEKKGDDESYVKENFFAKLKSLAGKIPFVFDAVSLYYCAMDPITPLAAKGIAFGALAYFILPTDIVVDLIPMFGLMDDAGVIAAAIGALASQITDEHRNQASMFLYDKPYTAKA